MVANYVSGLSRYVRSCLFWIGQGLVMLEDEGCPRDNPRDIFYQYNSCFEGLVVSQFSLLGVSITTAFIYRSGSSPQPSSLRWSVFLAFQPKGIFFFQEEKKRRSSLRFPKFRLGGSLFFQWQELKIPHCPYVRFLHIKISLHMESL